MSMLSSRQGSCRQDCADKGRADKGCADKGRAFRGRLAAQVGNNLKFLKIKKIIKGGQDKNNRF